MKSVPWAKVRGPLAPFADGFRAELDRLGYTPASWEYKVNQMANLSRWLEGEGLGAADVDAERMGAFLRWFGATAETGPDGVGNEAATGLAACPGRDRAGRGGRT